MVGGGPLSGLFRWARSWSAAFNLAHAAIAEAWNTMQLASIAPKKPNSTPDLAQSLTEADLKLLVARVLDKCDALDGVKDGIISIRKPVVSIQLC